MSFMFFPFHPWATDLRIKEDYRDDSTVMDELITVVVQSLDKASREGVLLTSGERVYPIPIGNKGDWPYLDF